METKLPKITFKEFFNTIMPFNRYSYLGYTLNPYFIYSDKYNIIEDFIKNLDKLAKPKYCPRFVLRLLHLYGNDNSIVRLRNKFLSDLRFKLTNGIMITDIKTKWDEYDIRIYGYFPLVVDEEIEKLEELFDELRIKYNG